MTGVKFARAVSMNLAAGLRSVTVHPRTGGRMSPTHPELLLAQALAANRWRTRRQLWPQTLVLGAAALVLAAAVAMAAWQRAEAPAQAALAWLQGHPAVVAAMLLVLAYLRVRLALVRAEAAFRSGAFAALPVLPMAEARWRNRVAIHAGGTLVAAVVILLASLLVMARKSGFPGGISAGSLAVMPLAAMLAGTVAARWTVGAVPGPVGRRRRDAWTPRGPWFVLSRADLPHVPLFLAQSGQVAWRHGRAAAGLFVLLMIAPQEARAVVVPVIGLWLWAAVHALEQGHRHVAALCELLATQPLAARRVLAAVAPFTVAWTLGFLLVAGTVLALAGVPLSGVLLMSLFATGLAGTDLLLAVRLCRAPRRFNRIRIVAATLAIVCLVHAPPLLLAWPLAWVLAWRGVDR